MLFDSQKQLLNENFHVTNNPYAYIDPDGKNPLLITAAIGAGAGAVIGGGISAYIQYRDTGSVNLADVGKVAGAGAVGGGVIGLTLGAGATLGISAGVTGVVGGLAGGEATELTSSLLNNEGYLFNPNRAVTNAILGGGLGALGDKIGGSSSQTLKTSNLPKEAQSTLKLIEGGKAESLKTLNSHVFENRPVGGKSLLPKHSDSKYYMAYDINVPGTTNRGTQRFVIGKNGERYYTKDHYKSFNKVSGGKKWK